jgi:carbon-monoxide dehydrogenase small subunit
MIIYFKLNGTLVSIDTPPEKRLVDLLRENFGLLKSKGLCYKGQCGCCTVLVDDKPVPSCLTPAFSIKNTSITTPEGLIKTKEYKFIQKHFKAKEHIPCGYCRWGKFFTIYDLLHKKNPPTGQNLINHFSGNQCNCTDMDSFIEIVETILNKRKEGGF